MLLFLAEGWKNLWIMTNLGWTKPIYISGSVVKGVLEVSVSTKDANLTVGHWQFSIDSLTATLKSEIKSHVTLSTNISYSTSGHPTPLHVFLISGKINDRLTLLSPRKKSWIDFSNASNALKFFFRDEETKRPCGDFSLFGVVLLRRVE